MNIDKDLKSQIFFLSKCKGDLHNVFIENLDKNSDSICALRAMAEKMSADELKQFEGYEEYFNKAGCLTSKSERCAAAGFVCCANYYRNRERLNKYYREYNYEEDPIFEASDVKDLQHNEDLLDYRVFKRAVDSRAVYFKRKWYALDVAIPAQMLEWADGCFKDNKVYARLSPYYSGIKKPSSELLEAIVYQTDTHWWKKLTVFKGQSKGYIGELDQSEIATNVFALKDSNNGFLRFEMSCTRDNKGNMTIMIEELQEFVNPLDNSDHYILGRMVHLDTDSMNVEFDKAMMNHIDLAYNLYHRDTADIRKLQHLPIDGQVVDADPRSHLIKVMDLPFKYLPKICKTFFRSDYLFPEWIKAQFE